MAFAGGSGAERPATGDAELWVLAATVWRRPLGDWAQYSGRFAAAGDYWRYAAGISLCRYGLRSDRPLRFDRGKLILAGFGFHGIARLKPGVTIAQANADMTRMLPIWMDSLSNGPGSNPHIYETWKITPMIRPLKQEVVGNVSEVLWVVMGTIGLVMLIACANVTNLLLVRVESRQQELAVRAALGAGWAAHHPWTLVESVMLGLLGGIVGVGLAYAGVRFLAAIGPANLPRLSEISIDARTLGFAFFLSVLSGLLFGLVPALKYAGPRASLELRSAGRTISVSRERHRARNLLVVGQVAMALVLLVSAGLMIRTFQALRAVDPGFTDAQHLQVMRISIPDSLVPEAERRDENAERNARQAIRDSRGEVGRRSQARCRWKVSTPVGTRFLLKAKPIPTA